MTSLTFIYLDMGTFKNIMSGRFSMIPWKLKLTWKKAYRVMAVAADKDDVDCPSAIYTMKRFLKLCKSR